MMLIIMGGWRVFTLTKNKVPWVERVHRAHR